MDSADNPFLTRSDLPYELPPFDRIDESHFVPAFEHGMAEQRAEVDVIAGNPDKPTFENTVEALERSGQVLGRVTAVFSNQANSHTNETVQRIEAEISPRLTTHEDAIRLDPRLFARVQAVYDARDGLDPESTRLVERYHLEFVRAGAGLDDHKKARLRELNEDLAALSTKFQHNLLDDTNASAVVVEDLAFLDGMSDDAVAAAAEAAREQGRDGKYLISLVLPTGQPSLTSLTNRAMRERIHQASVHRAANGNQYDNSDVAVQIATLRAERAVLLGFPDHATYVLADMTAARPETVHDLLGTVTPLVVAKAEAEADILTAELDDGDELRAWDWPFYLEAVRRKTFELDDAELRPYFELERVLHDGVFFAANRLYGISLVERLDLPRYHPDVRLFEVFDADGSPLGLFLGDYFARESKRGGAWMDTLVDQSTLMGTHSVVVNNLNLTRAPAGEPTLISLDDVKTLFHEFGHALHALFSAVRYPIFSGTSVLRDVGEFPSEVNEMWMLWPEVLANYAKHHQSGEELPHRLVDRLVESRIWGDGHTMAQYLAAALLDLAWHQIRADEKIENAQAFESEALERAGVRIESIPPRYRTTYFAHVFSGGYSAGYYAYVWSEALDADTVEWFKENGGLRRENGDRFRQILLSRGGSADMMQLFRELRGRDVRIEPLLVRHGLERQPS